MRPNNKIPDQVFGVKIGDEISESSLTSDYGEAITEANERNGQVVTYKKTD